MIQSKSNERGKLNIVGIGPGNDDHITPAALTAIREAEIIIGYTTYISLIRHHIIGKQVTRTGMTEEISRARNAVETAERGKVVSLISSGDSGVYGMAGLVFEVLRERGWNKGQSPDVCLIPGITAANSCASLVGAPLIHDSCKISLSDLLTPWPIIESRILAAAQGDFVICLYNPASGRRQRQIVEAAKIIRNYRLSTTPVALIKSAYRKQENIVISDLDHFLEFEIGMNTTVIIGSSQTFVYEGYMITPRGHTNKYRMADGSVLPGQRRAKSLVCEGSLAERFSGHDAVEPKLNITPIHGAFVKTTTEILNQDEFLKLNENYEEQEGPKDQGTQVWNGASENSALQAIQILSRIQPNGRAIPSQIPEVRSDTDSLSNDTKGLGWIARLCGAIVFRSEGHYFLIGELKEPCVFEEYGFELPQREGTADRHWVELRLKDPCVQSKLNFSVALNFSGPLGANQVYRSFAIYRNSSISERLMNLVLDVSPRFQLKEQEMIDARWLSGLPFSIWQMIRDSILKCS